MSSFSFSSAPVLRRSRHIFDGSYTHFTDLNVGDLKPVYLQEVYPGDQFNIKSKGVIRSVYPFKRPIMDNLFIDIAYFFVPYRLVNKTWEQTITGGTAEPDDYTSPKDIDIPTYTSDTPVPVNTVLDILGVPSNTTAKGVSVMPARAFAKIWNDWFRDENTMQSCLIQKGAVSDSEAPNNNDWAPNNYTGKLPKVSKIHDYFTSALRSTQKGSPVEIPISGTFNGALPINTRSSVTDVQYPLQLKGDLSSSANGGTLELGPAGEGGSAKVQIGSTGPSGTIRGNITGTNMYAQAQGVSINLNPLLVNDLRMAFATQKILERCSRSGSRYTEYILSAFAVQSPDSRLQRSEYLGGSSTPINIQQVASTFGENGTQGETSLGSLSAYSFTNNYAHASKAFVEHGYIIGVAWIRQFHTYQQGIEKFLLRKSRFDFFDPALQNIGEQPVMLREIFNGTKTNNTVFGYQEAWADMRSRRNVVSGRMRSTVESDTQGLDLYHLGDKFATAPTLSQAFIQETSDNVWRAFGLDPSSPAVADLSQFIVDFRFNVKAIKELPAYSVPSLIDHH